MKEDFLHYIWKHELFAKVLNTDTNDTVEVLSPGQHNHDSGPDFINARIKINSTIWAGNVEIHTNSANWNLHKHHEDPAYNNVILHIATDNKRKCIAQNGTLIPTAILDYDSKIFENYRKIESSKTNIPCQETFTQVDEFKTNQWLNVLCADRLESKTQQILETLDYTNNNWEEAFYIVLARNFGFKTNSLPFELLAKSIPLKVLSKYHSSIFQLESLLFGQAGFLQDDIRCDYYVSLYKEYSYQRKIHQLKPLDKHLWKFLRLRPTNFPTVRIAQFAALVNKSKHLFSQTIEAKNIKDLIVLYSCTASDYWNTHYNFGKSGIKRIKKIGKSALNGIIINTVIPFVFIYGKQRIKPKLSEQAMNLLEQIESEQNSIINNWKEIGMNPSNAAQSQALIHLTNNYCLPKNCLYCQIGNEIIRKQN